MQQLILPAVNLLILLGFLGYKTRKPFAEYVKGRHLNVFEGLNRSKAQAAEAEARKKDIEAKLSTIDLERQRIAGEWKEREVQQIRALQESSQRIIAQMRVEADRNKAALEESYRLGALKTISQMVLQQAEEKIRRGLTPEVHRHLNEQVTKTLGVS